MYLGSIAQKESGIAGSYTYMRRGTCIPSFPDLYPDLYSEPHKNLHLDLLKDSSLENSASNECIPFEKGSLFNKETIGWKWLTVLDIGVDIVIKLDKPCFIDRIAIHQGSESAVKSVRALCSDTDGVYACKGRVDAATSEMLESNHLEVTLGVEAQNIIIRLDACFKDIVIEGLDIIGAVFDDYMVYPVPASINMSKGTAMHISNIEHIVIGKESSDDTAFAANLLKEKLHENYSLSLPIVYSEELQSHSNSIVLGKCNEIAMLDSGINSAPSAEGYIINACEGAVYLQGADRRGLIYGVEALLMLINDKEIPACIVNDYPFMGIRGVHFGLPPREEIPFIKRLIRYVFAPMRMNTIFLEFAGGMRYDRHPEINKVWEEGNKKAKDGKWPPFPHGDMVSGGSVLEKQEVADLVDYARSYGIEVIPEVQSLGHVQYITKAYPEVAETEYEDNNTDKDKADIDLKKEDAPPDKFYKDSYCPSNEKSYSIIFDLIDEIVEVVRPTEYVHMGHDEVYTMGTCPLCKDKDHADLYASDVNKLYNYLASKNLKMMIWGDMLHNVTKYKTPPAIDKIPKDIVLLDFIWYFHLDKDIEEHLLDHGFKVIMGNMYSSHYPRFEKRARENGIIGAEVSTWKRMDEYNMGFEGKIYDFIYSANMMWSSSYRSDLRLSYDFIISRLMPRIRSQIHGEAYPSLSETKRCLPVVLPEQQSTAPIPWELSTILGKQGGHTLNGLPFNIGAPQVVLTKTSSMGQSYETLTIPVNHAFDSLIFLHAAGENVERIPWKNPYQIGSYIVEYEDGTRLEVPIEYGANIGVWYKRYGEPLKHAYYRHQGYVSTYFADAYIQSKTSSGKDVTVYGYEWINPYKDKTIVSVELAAKGDTDASVMLFAVTGIKR
ncbi:MAG TPA: family 20 glycosylhydrolase [Clostridiales bacterium]|nr:family 20 glycosylhydrolase [Clostridiales bacterium]